MSIIYPYQNIPPQLSYILTPNIYPHLAMYQSLLHSCTSLILDNQGHSDVEVAKVAGVVLEDAA